MAVQIGDVHRVGTTVTPVRAIGDMDAVRCHEPTSPDHVTACRGGVEVDDPDRIGAIPVGEVDVAVEYIRESELHRWWRWEQPCSDQQCAADEGREQAHGQQERPCATIDREAEPPCRPPAGTPRIAERDSPRDRGRVHRAAHRSWRTFERGPRIAPRTGSCHPSPSSDRSRPSNRASRARVPDGLMPRARASSVESKPAT